MKVVHKRKEGVSSPPLRSPIWIRCGLDMQVCSSLIHQNIVCSVYQLATSALSVGQPLPGSSDPWASQEGAPTYPHTCHPQLRLSQGHPSSRWQPSTLPCPPLSGAAPPQTASWSVKPGWVFAMQSPSSGDVVWMPAAVFLGSLPLGREGFGRQQLPSGKFRLSDQSRRVKPAVCFWPWSCKDRGLC